ncbi:MAG TPA: ABC transporter permease, partial [Gammaproteobacteria bacterium]
QLRVPGQVLFDRLSRDLYGAPAPGDSVLLDGQHYRLGGYFELGPNLVYDGLVLMSTLDWLRLHPRDTPLFALVELESGAPLAEVRERLRRALPDDIVVLTPNELRAREVSFTVSAAPIGYIFGLGAALGLLVGLIFCYQVLYNLVLDHQRPIATLRAMGFADGYLARAVLAQALLIACLGALPGLLASHGAYAAVAAASQMAMQLSPARAAAIAAGTLLFCLLAGLAAARRLGHFDPAELL